MHNLIKRTSVITSPQVKLLTRFIRCTVKVAAHLSIRVLHHLNEDGDEVKYNSSLCLIVSHI